MSQEKVQLVRRVYESVARRDRAGTLALYDTQVVRMAIVTDNWGDADSVRRKHDRIGLEGFFEAFAVSSELGCNKPDARMYRTASDALGLEAAECFYVDDDPALVKAAMMLGYKGAAISRNGPPCVTDVHVMSRLDELLQLIADP